MNKFLILLLITAFGIIGWMYIQQNNSRVISPLSKPRVEKPLLKYTFKNLSEIKFISSPLLLGKKRKETEDLISYLFYYYAPSSPGEKNKLKVSGVINLPKKPGIYPLIILLRGYVPIEIYRSGVGSERVGEALAKDGFISLAPDFLGYGDSDKPSQDVFEERFQTYTTVLTLLSSLPNLNKTLVDAKLENISADTVKVGFWAHSNGGQIAISVLEISRAKYPTILWAPVSKPFPYSILYYTDEYDDQGKALRKNLAKFEENYDVLKYSPNNYYGWIKAPLQIHQGLTDDAVPVVWSNELVEILKKQKKEVEYFQYADADHNLMPLGWQPAVERSIKFFKENL